VILGRPSIQDLCRRPYFAHRFSCRICKLSDFHATQTRGSRCASGITLAATARVASDPTMSSRVRAAWAPFERHRRDCNDCGRYDDGSGFAPLCQVGARLFELGVEVIRALASKLPPGPDAIVVDQGEEDDDAERAEKRTA
jgi:hypothetical protein